MSYRALGWVVLGVVAGCSPEAHRARDGGPGADPGNKNPVEAAPADPRTRDTSLWPGKSLTPVERLERGDTLLVDPRRQSPAALPSR